MFSGVRLIKYQQIGIDDRCIAFEGVFQHSENGCAFLLARFRIHSGSLTRAAFLSAPNDAMANVAIIAAGAVTAFVWRTAWPDLIVGIAVATMNVDAAREVWSTARKEHAAEA